MADTPNDPRNNPEQAEPGASARPAEQPTAEIPATDGAQQPQSGDEQSAGHQAEQSAQQPSQPAEPQHPHQPTEPAQSAQPTQPTQSYPQPSYGAGAFGQPAHEQQGAQNPYWQNPGDQAGQPGYGQNPYAHTGQHYHGAYQHTGQQPGAQPGYATQPTQPLPDTRVNDEPRGKKRVTGLVIAGLVVGAVIGGASGAGVMGIYEATQSDTAKPVASTGATNITVNDAKNATSVTAVAAKASPSVVTISVSGGQSAGTGSGVVLTSDGYVLTNTHVVTLDGQIAKPKIQVQDNNGKLYSATVVGTDPTVDLAVIKLDNASGMTPATFADSSKLNVGDQAVAIGAPLGLSGTVTDGIVSALNRSIQIASSAAPQNGNDQQQQGQGGNNFWNFDLPGQGGQSQQPTSYISLPVVQTDAAINPGNSGGALLNSKGQVIGINVAIASASQSSSGGQSGSIGVGFAIPSDLAQRVGTELMKNGSATHGLLGATVSDVGSSSTTVGAEIKSVSDGGAAAKAGLQKGDVVTNFNKVPIQSATDLTAQVRYLAGGATADLTYVRDGKPYTATVTLGTLKQ